MDTTRKREAIRKVYSGEGWSLKVDAMPDYQVDAVYDRFVQDGLVAAIDTLWKTQKIYDHISQEVFIDKTRATEYESYKGEQIKFDI